VTISINDINYSTIQQAVDAALDGQTIFVSAGTYREQVTVSGKNITIQGAWIGSPVIGNWPHRIPGLHYGDVWFIPAILGAAGLLIVAVDLGMMARGTRQ
jgi:hypothetical protein